MSRQYTIRSIPAALDRALRNQAREEAKSLNTVVVEALARGVNFDAKPAEYTDLDNLIGSWQEDTAFDQAIAEFQKIDDEVWK